MTSLSHQLKKLKKAPTHALAIERDYSSLIFDKQNAESYDRNDFYKIGLAGLVGMKKLDNEFDFYEPELFEKKMIKFNRAMIGKEEANELNQKIEKMLIRLSPYFHHQCCREVLEWLIHKFQIHSYNAEILFFAFLPFHSINSFGRLLNILKFNSPDFNWLEEYQKDAAPIPHNILCRACQSGRSYWLITTLSKFINNSITILDENYINNKMEHYFIFLVSLYGTLIENRGPTMDEQLISRLIPFIGISLKSNLESFKYCGIMLTCILSINVPINNDIAKNLLKLIFYKLDLTSSEFIFQVANIICERLELNKLPKKSILNLIKQTDLMELTRLFHKLIEKYEIISFLSLFWKILIEEILSEENAIDLKRVYTEFFITLLDLHRLSNKQAETAFDLFLNYIESSNEDDINNEEETKKIFPKILRKHIKTMIISFPNAFDSIQKRRKNSIIQKLLKECKVSNYIVGN